MQKRKNFSPREAVFDGALLALGLLALKAALQLWQTQPEPKAASAAMTPLLASAVWSLLAACALVRDLMGKPSPAQTPPEGEKLFPRPVLELLGLCAAYCLALRFGAGFYPATGVLLLLSMLRLGGGKKRALLWTALLLLAIYLIFGCLLRVALP